MTRRFTSPAVVGLPVVLIALTAVPTRSLAQGGSASSTGEALFAAKCAACHSSGADRLVGPGLGDINERRERDWLLEFITAPDRVIASGDSIATRLVAEYGMPMPNMGVSRDEAALILDFLAAPPGSEPASAAPAGVRRSAVGGGPSAGDPAVGRQLFTGGQALTNGGGACVSCHSVPGIGALGGGTLARDLTTAATTYGAGLPQVLKSPPFPLMQAVYGARPLTDEEVAHLGAFLQEIAVSEAAARPRPLPFAAAGAGGMVLLLVLAAVTWRGRLRGVRKPLIGERA